MSSISRFEDLEAWVQARSLVSQVYRSTKESGFSRDFSLRDQIQRAAISVMTNIAEGFERRGRPEKLHFYNIARASCGEVRSLLYACEDLGYLNPALSKSLMSQCNRSGMLLTGLIRSCAAVPKSDLRSANSDK